jgi:hypothetical protein
MTKHDSECEAAGTEGLMCKCNERMKANNHQEFIRLWTAASPSPAYDKSVWKLIELQLRETGLI